MQRDKRGFPIPYIILRDKSGQPHFTINDEEKRTECLVKRRCAVCGKHLEKTFWFVGGPMSAFHENGAYLDTALHQECMEYALQVCPYLAAPRYQSRIDAKKLDPDLFDGYIMMNNTMIPGRPTVFVCVKTSDFTIMYNGYIRLQRPYLNIQYWDQSVRLSVEEGMKQGGLALKGESITIDPKVVEAAEKTANEWLKKNKL